MITPMTRPAASCPLPTLFSPKAISGTAPVRESVADPGRGGRWAAAKATEIGDNRLSMAFCR
jgi:hypothetical protein